MLQEGWPSRPATEEMLTMEPVCRERKCGRRARIRRTGAEEVGFELEVIFGATVEEHKKVPQQIIQ